MSAVLPGTPGVSAPRSPAGEADRSMVDPHPPSAVERLEASRSRLRGAMMAIAHPPPKPSLLGDLGIGSFGNQILERLKALPGAALLIESIKHWWMEHPLHAASALAEEASQRYVAPIARKNPFALVIGAVVFGALFVASKPWRWLLRPALLVGLVPQIAAQVLKRMPLDSWLELLSAVTGKRAAAGAEAKEAAPPTPASGLPKDP